jgi:hypothetical protein
MPCESAASFRYLPFYQETSVDSSIGSAQLRLGEEFDSKAVLALATGQRDVVWHRGFYGSEICEAVLPAIRKACDASDYSLTDDLQSLGTSMGEAELSAAHEEEYFSTAPQTRDSIRSNLFQPYLSPIDLIRLLADEAWPAGATIARQDSKQMLSGIVRRWVKGGQANPHIDQRELPILATLELQRRIAVNVYLATPPAGQGGEIEFWDRIDSEAEYERMKRSDYGIDRDQLGEPAMVIHPNPGDLVAFDAARLHGVRGVDGGERVTAACFLGVRDAEHPLYQFA